MTRLFFATDVHGSEKCFGKFLNSGKFYKADVLILGGDVTGKVMVPILATATGGWSCRLLGADYEAATEEELQSLEKKIRFSGYYPFRTTQAEMEDLRANQSRLDQVFSELMIENLKHWMSMAEEKLKPQGVRCFISGGNDDRLDIKPILKSSDFIVDPEDQVVHVDDQHEMITSGYSNITPWNCPRDIPDGELLEKITAMAGSVHDMSNAIFNLHCPPYDAGIDTAPELDKDLKPVTRSGQPSEIAAGSKAVREAIERYQPLLGLHGHIHESKGEARIGRTVCLNPGSEYSEGILRGVIVDLTDKGMKSFQFTSG
jgi:Icc-related predicted phosphoesterase